MASLEQQVDEQYDEHVEQQLTDSTLFPLYLQQKSVVQRVDSFVQLLKRHHVADNVIQDITVDYMSQIIPPGVKAVVRGARFEEIVRSEIEELKLDPEVYEVRFEKDIHAWQDSDEKPDFIIRHRMSDRMLMGMVQMDLWSGGHQINRGYKYVFHPYSTQRKMLSVVCHRPNLKMPVSKVSRMFAHGLGHKTLCYPKGLRAAIQAFFQGMLIVQ
jgi:hypothetical protein